MDSIIIWMFTVLVLLTSRCDIGDASKRIKRANQLDQRDQPINTSLKISNDFVPIKPPVVNDTVMFVPLRINDESRSSLSLPLQTVSKQMNSENIPTANNKDTEGAAVDMDKEQQYQQVNNAEGNAYKRNASSAGGSDFYHNDEPQINAKLMHSLKSAGSPLAYLLREHETSRNEIHRSEMATDGNNGAVMIVESSNIIPILPDHNLVYNMLKPNMCNHFHSQMPQSAKVVSEDSNAKSNAKITEQYKQALQQTFPKLRAPSCDRFAIADHLNEKADPSHRPIEPKHTSQANGDSVTQIDASGSAASAATTDVGAVDSASSGAVAIETMQTCDHDGHEPGLHVIVHGSAALPPPLPALGINKFSPLQNFLNFANMLIYKMGTETQQQMRFPVGFDQPAIEEFDGLDLFNPVVAPAPPGSQSVSSVPSAAATTTAMGTLAFSPPLLLPAHNNEPKILNIIENALDTLVLNEEEANLSTAATADEEIELRCPVHRELRKDGTADSSSDMLEVCSCHFVKKKKK